MIKAEKRKTYKAKSQSKLDEFITKTIKTFEKEINQRGCIGSIAEIYDSSKPYEPKGTMHKQECIRNFKDSQLGRF